MLIVEGAAESVRWTRPDTGRTGDLRVSTESRMIRRPEDIGQRGVGSGRAKIKIKGFALTSD